MSKHSKLPLNTFGEWVFTKVIHLMKPCTPKTRDFKIFSAFLINLGFRCILRTIYSVKAKFVSYEK